MPRSFQNKVASNEARCATSKPLFGELFAKARNLRIHSVGNHLPHLCRRVLRNLRQTLEPALIGIARDLAEQVAEDTATQVRQVVSDTVDAEIARLREQFAKKRF